MTADLRAWAVEWHSKNRLDGNRRHLIWGHDHTKPGFFRLFRTRAEARTFIEERFGYIRERPDLRAEPNGWYMPQAVRVEVNRETAAIDTGLSPERAG